MKLIEQFIEGKTGDPATCEDGLFFNENFAAVIDGVTSKSPRRWDGQTSGKIATGLILETLPKLRPDITAWEAIQQFNRVIADWYVERGVYDHMAQTPLDRCSACLIMYSHAAKQLWSLGDCQALIDGNALKYDKESDFLLREVRAFYLESELLLGKTIEDLLERDTGREFILPLLERQKLFQNTPNEFGSWVIDGFLEEVSALDVREISADTRSLVLASDGYPALLPDLESTERVLKENLAKDPLCFREIKATKGVTKGLVSFDDRAYLRLEL